MDKCVHGKVTMINFIKRFFQRRKEDQNAKLMKKEYEVLMYLIKYSDSLQDFVFCKKKIRKFDYKWNTEDMTRFNPRVHYNKLLREYNHELRERGYRWSDGKKI